MLVLTGGIGGGLWGNPSALQWHLYCDEDLDEASTSTTTKDTSTSSLSPARGYLSDLLQSMNIGGIENWMMLTRKLRNFEDLSFMASCRHFVGYCSEAKVVLGTSNATYEMRYTALQVAQGVTASLKSLTLSAGYQGFINVEG